MELPSLTTTVVSNTSSTSQTSHATMQPKETNPNASSLYLLMIKEEINQLKTIIAKAVAQIIQAIASLHDNNKCTSLPNNAMEMEAANRSSDTVQDSNPLNLTTIDLLAIINELKTEIEMFTKENHAIIQP